MKNIQKQIDRLTEEIANLEEQINDEVIRPNVRIRLKMLLAAKRRGLDRLNEELKDLNK